MPDGTATIPVSAAGAITCPLCHTEGWPSSLLTQGFAAHCGTAWDHTGFFRQSHVCRIIAGLRFEVALLSGEVAA